MTCVGNWSGQAGGEDAKVAIKATGWLLLCRRDDPPRRKARPRQEGWELNGLLDRAYLLKGELGLAWEQGRWGATGDQCCAWCQEGERYRYRPVGQHGSVAGPSCPGVTAWHRGPDDQRPRGWDQAQNQGHAAPVPRHARRQLPQAQTLRLARLKTQACRMRPIWGPLAAGRQNLFR
jgi:hypothetical protein